MHETPNGTYPRQRRCHNEPGGPFDVGSSKRMLHKADKTKVIECSQHHTGKYLHMHHKKKMQALTDVPVKIPAEFVAVLHSKPSMLAFMILRAAMRPFLASLPVVACRTLRRS